MLFNEAKVEALASEIQTVYPTFAKTDFVKRVVSAFPNQELMERIFGIRDSLFVYLPREYEQALTVILAALPPPLTNDKRDDDFGDFIYAPYSYYVAAYGCTQEHFTASLAALAEITKRFSAEAALRDFINLFPNETLSVVSQFAKSSEYHVRRLASEGTRPALPWAKKITYDIDKTFPILDVLHADKTRYVTRSVANHLNDVSKFDPDRVLQALARWKKQKRQTPAELTFITKHALRTLVKAGDQRALALLGYGTTLATATLELAATNIIVGSAVSFVVTLENQSLHEAELLVHYVIHFKKANGTLSPKVFLAKKLKLAPGEKLTFKKSHALKLMTTRVLYAGQQQLELRVNGVSVAQKNFTLT